MAGSSIGEVKQGHIYRTRLEKMEAHNQQLGDHGLRLAHETELARKATSGSEQKITEILSEKVGLERRILDLERQMIQERSRRGCASEPRADLEILGGEAGESSGGVRILLREVQASGPRRRSRSQDGQLSLSRHGLS